MPKITRDAFLYIGGPGDKQCRSCWLFAEDKKRCLVLPKNFEVVAADSCGYWGYQEPFERQEVPDNLPTFTPEEVGFVSRKVRCENCVYFDDDECNFYKMLNDRFPQDFDLDTEVEATGCCNAQTPPEDKKPARSRWIRNR